LSSVSQTSYDAWVEGMGRSWVANIFYKSSCTTLQCHVTDSALRGIQSCLSVQEIHYGGLFHVRHCQLCPTGQYRGLQPSASNRWGGNLTMRKT
jgi:hypothetical protein